MHIFGHSGKTSIQTFTQKSFQTASFFLCSAVSGLVAGRIKYMLLITSRYSKGLAAKHYRQIALAKSSLWATLLWAPRSVAKLTSLALSILSTDSP